MPVLRRSFFELRYLIPTSESWKLNYNFDQMLLTAGYQLDASFNVWSRPDFSGISYSDGDAIERRIESIIDSASDLSVFSDELGFYCTDWAST